MGYVGNQAGQGFTKVPPRQDLTGATGGTLTLSHAVASAEGIDLFINNVRQEPTESYSVAGTTVTLNGYTVAASDSIYVVYNALALNTTTHPSTQTLQATDGIFSGGITVGQAVQGKTNTQGSNTGNITLDFDTYQNFILTLTGDITLVNPTSTVTTGQAGVIVLIQDGSGNRSITAIGTDFETPKGTVPAISSGANATDVIPYMVIASNRILLGTPQKEFS